MPIFLAKTVCMYVCVCVYIYIYIYLYIHTHIHVCVYIYMILHTVLFMFFCSMFFITSYFPLNSTAGKGITRKAANSKGN